MDSRPHTGRRRNEATRQAILAAARQLLLEGDGPVTVDAIAQRAGIGRQTIYRWWPSKGAVLLEALAGESRRLIPIPDAGSLEDDLTSFVTDLLRALGATGNAALLRALAAEAARDQQTAELLQAFVQTGRDDLTGIFERARSRQEVDADVDLSVLVDQAFGFCWLRLLSGREPLDDDVAQELARDLTAGARRSARPSGE